MAELQEPLSPNEAKRKILLILDEGIFELSLHCRRDSMPKRNVSTQDVLNALKTGQIIKEPEWDGEYENWKYRVEGVDIEGDDLIAITVIFDSNLSLLVVTVF
jgi:hypothetical protein